MPDARVEYLIEILKKGDGAKQAEAELTKADGAATKLGGSLSALRSGFAAVSGAIALRQGIQEFAEAERATAKLNGALLATGQASAALRNQLLEAAGVLSKQTNIDDANIVNVMAKLISFGSGADEVDRLTRIVLDLSTVLDKDLGRATLGIGQALQGNFAIFDQFGIKIDKSRSLAEQLEQGLGGLEGRFKGQAVEAAKTLGAQFDKLNETAKELTKELGRLAAAATLGLNTVFDRIAAVAATPGALTEILDRRDAYVKEAEALRQLIAEKVRLNQLSLEEAAALQRKIGLGRENLGIDPGLNALTLEERQAAIESSRTRLDQAGSIFSSIRERFSPSAPKPKLASTRFAQEEQDRRNAAGHELFESLMEAEKEEQELAKKIHEDKLKQAEELQRTREENDARDIASAQRVADMERQLTDELILVGKEGRERERVEIELLHQDRLAKIRELSFENEDDYHNLIEGENALHEAQKLRFQVVNSANFQLKQDLKQIGEFAQQAFAGGLASALVDIASGAEKADVAIKKFFGNFLQLIAQAILQSLILRAVSGIFGEIAGQASAAGGAAASAATGGQFKKLAAGGTAMTNGPAYFPGFGVLAGEAGRELLTVLARPRTVDLGGLKAQIGEAGARKLAIVDLHALMGLHGPRKLSLGGQVASGGASVAAVSSGGAGGAGGVIQVQVQMSPGLEAKIVKNSVERAVVEVTNGMKQDGRLSRSVRKLTNES